MFGFPEFQVESRRVWCPRPKVHGVLVDYCANWRVLYSTYFRMTVRVQVESREEGINIRYPVSRNAHRPLDSVLYAGCSMRAGAVGELPYWSAPVPFSISSVTFPLRTASGRAWPSRTVSGKITSGLLFRACFSTLAIFQLPCCSVLLSFGCRLHSGDGRWSLLRSWRCSAFVTAERVIVRKLRSGG